MKIKGTRIPYRLIDGYVEKYGEKFKKELSDDYPYISQEHLDDYLINLYEQNKRYREALEEIKQEGEFMDFRTGRKIYNTQGRIADEALEGF